MKKETNEMTTSNLVPNMILVKYTSGPFTNVTLHVAVIITIIAKLPDLRMYQCVGSPRGLTAAGVV